MAWTSLTPHEGNLSMHSQPQHAITDGLAQLYGLAYRAYERGLEPPQTPMSSLFMHIQPEHALPVQAAQRLGRTGSWRCTTPAAACASSSSTTASLAPAAARRRCTRTPRPSSAPCSMARPSRPF